VVGEKGGGTGGIFKKRSASCLVAINAPLPGRHPLWNQSKRWCYRHFLGVNGRENAFPHRARSQPVKKYLNHVGFPNREGGRTSGTQAPYLKIDKHPWQGCH
jgi:hypothetical protein